MNSFYLILGSEAALADRALTKLTAQLKDEKCEITTLFAADLLVGDIADSLAPSLFSERRGLIIRDLQDLPEDSKDEVTRYLDSPDSSTTVVFVHKGGVKGKALLDAIKKVKPEIIACEPIKKEAEHARTARDAMSGGTGVTKSGRAENRLRKAASSTLRK